MDKIVDAQFQRVEKALATLINSIATYNPNPAHANDLYNADQDLARSLETLTQHQKNHARLQKLQAESQELDSQIKDSIQLLVDTRRELIATPVTTFPPNPNLVSYSELLSYARRISKFTRPPAFREEEPEAEQDPGSREKSRTATPVTANGVASTQNGAGDSNTAGANGNRSVPSSRDAEGIRANDISTALPAPIVDWINPLNTAPTFVPWPLEEVVRRGALASIQILVDQGVDPATFDPEKSQELEAERKRQEEEIERQKEEAEAEKRARQQAANAQAGAPRARVKPAVFTGLDLLDDDEDDG